MFYSSGFSVSPERIEENAARNGLCGFSFPPCQAIADILSGSGSPDREAIRQNLQGCCELLFKIFELEECKPLISELFRYFEAEYSRRCLELLKREDIGISREELALPFLVIDVCTLAAERFFNGDFTLWNSAQIPADFFANLDIPAVLKEKFAKKFCTV